MLAFGTKRCGLDMIQYIYYVSLTKRLGCRFGNLISSNWRLDTEIEIDTFMASLCLIVMLNPRSKVLKVVEKLTWYMVVAHDGGKVMSFGAFSIHDRSQGRSVLCVLIRCKRFDLCKTNCIHQDKVCFALITSHDVCFDIEIWGHSAAPNSSAIFAKWMSVCLPWLN